MLRFNDVYFTMETIIGEADLDEIFRQREAVRQARETLRTLSNELIAFGHSEWLAVRVLKFIHFDPVLAGWALEKTAAAFAYDHEDRDKNYTAVDRALKF